MKAFLWSIAAAVALWAAPGRAETVVRLVEVLPSPERSEALRTLVGRFEAAQPGVRVEVISLPWDGAFERLAAMVAAGDAPDVAEMPDRWLSTYAAAGQLESLEPYMAGWPDTPALDPRALAAARAYGGTAYVLPYGFYMRALFYNKALFREAGIAAPPRTLDAFAADARAVSALPGKSGYCLRGGPGGLSAWMSFGAAMAGDGSFFDAAGTSTLSRPGWVAGARFLVDLYRSGGAPRDSVNWGFAEVLAGFASGQCAMLDQDPDALATIARSMPAEDLGIAAMPAGPSGRAYPVLGYAGWSLFKASPHKDLAWKLIAALDGREGDVLWGRATALLPIYGKVVSPDDPLAPWVDELRDPHVVPLLLPTALPKFGYFADVVAVESSQRALLGQTTPEQLAEGWADALTRTARGADPHP